MCLLFQEFFFLAHPYHLCKQYLKDLVARRGVQTLMILYLCALQLQILTLTKTPGTVTLSSAKILLKILLSLITILVKNI